MMNTEDIRTSLLAHISGTPTLPQDTSGMLSRTVDFGRKGNRQLGKPNSSGLRVPMDVANNHLILCAN
jgi:hypothetical protein